eukprot:456762-Rhodomonas_salina.2
MFRDHQGNMQNVSYPADLWALGVTLFHCLSGRLPFQAPIEYLPSEIVGCNPAPSLLDVLEPNKRSQLSLKFVEMLAKALEKDLTK